MVMLGIPSFAINASPFPKEIIMECTCKARTCYSCRRQEIDATALRIIERELQYGDQDHAEYVASTYRYPAINALAFEML